LPVDASQVRVNYHYGFVARIGGGTYARANTFSLDPAHLRLVRVPSDQTTIQAALNEVASTGGIVEIENSDAYFESPSVAIADGATVELRAADAKRPVLFLNGSMTVTGGPDSRFIMNGLWIAGGDVQVPDLADNRLRLFAIRHCTLSPAVTPSPADSSPPAELSPVRLQAAAPNLVLDIDHSIVGLLRVAEEVEARVTDSLVDAGTPTAMAYAGLTAADHGGPLTLRNATVIGRVRVDVMPMASNTILFARSELGEPPVDARRLQEGCVRFSYVPPGSRVPRQYQCQPALALATLADELGLAATTDLSTAQSNQVLARVKPLFTSLRFGDPAYGQLTRSTPIEIRHGADDESEMGVYHHLYQPQREVNLRTRLDEYLRFGLEAGIFYAT
jgi:hypothetical protein